MIRLVVLVTVGLVGSMAMTMTPVLDKPYYELENAEGLFRDFIYHHGKSYRGKEYFERLDIFKESLKNINRRNAEYPETVFAVNHFTDLKPEEQHQCRFRSLNETGVKVERYSNADSSVTLPTAFDWRDKGVVSHVKEQLNCSSCAIFSAIGNIEGQYAMKYNQCIALSEGQILDCLDYASCDGMCTAMDDIMQALVQKAGVMKEEDYPYKPVKDICHESSKTVANVLSGQRLDTPTEEALAETLVTVGPLAVALVVDGAFQSYHGGILHPDTCTYGVLNHAVVLVGYGETGTKYWILKNSWGENWGEKGYVRLLRGVGACKMGWDFTASATVAAPPSDGHSA